MDWKIQNNVAQSGKASWSNFIERVHDCTLDRAKKIATRNPEITFFFFCRGYLKLSGVYEKFGDFKAGDAVFFGGKPTYGTAPQCDAYEKATPSTEVNTMFSISRGRLSAPYTKAYKLSDTSFTFCAMIQPKSSGTLISFRFLLVALNDDGSIEFSINTHDTHRRIVSGKTSIIDSNQCHTLVCIGSSEKAQSKIYLDGQLLNTKTSPSVITPSIYDDIYIGNNASKSDQYTGIIMNVSVWPRILSLREANLAANDQIAELGEGPMAYWNLNNSFKDLSVNSNRLKAGDSRYVFHQCLDCITLYGPNSYSFCQIEGVAQLGEVKSLSYGKRINIGKDAVALIACIVDNSGYARFPVGAFVELTDPNGKIYNQDINSNDGSLFVKTRSVEGHNTNSLFAVLINNPIKGIWTVRVTAPSNVDFVFQMQSFPATDIVSSYVEAFEGTETRKRGEESKGWSWGKIFVGGALVIISVVAVIAAGGTGTAAFFAALAVSTGIILKVDSKLDEETPIDAVSVGINSPKTTVYETIVNALTNAHPKLAGKVWDTSMGTLPTNWIVQSGTVEGENNLKATFERLVRGATKSIDILAFGDISGDFATTIRNAIENYKDASLTIRIFSGHAPDIEVSIYVTSVAPKAYKTIVPGRYFGSHALNGANDITSESTGALPDNIKLYFGAGEAITYPTATNLISIPSGWGHHKIIIVDGTAAIIGGINFSPDSLQTQSKPTKAVNDLSILVEGGAVGSIQKFVNNFWDNLVASDYQFWPINSYYQEKNTKNFHGGIYLTSVERGVDQNFALLNSETSDPPNIYIPTLNSNVFKINHASQSDTVQMITVGRRSGYYYNKREPSDIALVNLIICAKTSICLSQHAMGYPTHTTNFLWEEAMIELGLAINRGVSVQILVSRNPKEEGDVNPISSYASDYADNVRSKILGYVIGKQSSSLLEVRNYSHRNHAKAMIIDNAAFYVGSQNIYPTKYSLKSFVQAEADLSNLGVNSTSPTSTSFEALIQDLKALIGESFLDYQCEVGLGECGVIVCDAAKTQDFIDAYWDEKWSAAATGSHDEL